MGRSKHELEKRDLAGIVASLRAKGDHIGLLKLFAIFAAIRDAAQNCGIALLNQLSKQLDQQINGGANDNGTPDSNGVGSLVTALLPRNLRPLSNSLRGVVANQTAVEGTLMARFRVELVQSVVELRSNHITKTKLVRRPNSELRPREHLTEREINKLIEVAKRNRWGQRDSTMVLMAYRHGLRASELCGLQWSDVEFESGTLHLRRVKNGITGTHPLLGDELRLLRSLRREAKSPFVFVSERNAPFSTAGFARLIERAGIAAKLPFKAHPHMLRHATGFALANRGTDTRTLQAYLGHRLIQSTVRYTELAPGRFKNIWR